MPQTRSHGNETDRGYARLAVLGITFLLTLVILAGIGFFVDKLLGTLPLFLLIGLGLGFVVGMFHVYLALKSLGGG